MIKFSELLKEYLSEKNVSTNAISKYTGIEHSTMYKILQGRRNPTNRETVKKIADCLRLTAKERDILLDAYYFSKLGEVKYYGAGQITELLDNLSDSRDAAFSLNKLPESQETEGDVVLHGSREILEAFFSVCEDAAGREEGKNTVRMLTTDFYPDSFPYFGQLLSNFPNLQIRHIVALDDSDQLDKDFHLYNLECFKTLFPLVIRHPNYEVKTIYTNIAAMRSMDQLLTETVVSPGMSLIFSHSGENGFLFRDPEKVEVCRRIIHDTGGSSGRFIQRTDPIQLLDGIKSFAASSQRKMRASRRTILFNPGICCILVLPVNERMTEKHLKFPEPLKGRFIRQFHEYLPRQKMYLQSAGKLLKIISTKQGVKYFIRTGFINEINPAIMTPLDIDERIDVLEKWRELYRKGAYLLVDYPKFHANSHSWVQLMEDTMAIQIAGEDGMYLMAETMEPDIVLLFNWYFDFISDEFAMEDEQVQEFFDDCFQFLKERM